VPVILLGYVFSGVYAVVTAGLYIERRTHVLAWIAGAGAVLNLSICIVAAPRWGMVSVAWATPAAYALMAALATWQSNRVFPVPFEWRRLAHLAMQVAALFAADRWIAGHGVQPLSVLGVASKLGLLAFLPVLLFATGFFRRGELRALQSMFPQTRTT
jgi:O-antigen/teichoic acid export membrane protein